MRKKKPNLPQNLKFPTSFLYAHLDNNGQLQWDHEGLSIAKPEEIGVRPNCVLLDIREYNRLKSLDKKTEEQQFLDNLEKNDAIVEKWPDWMKNAQGCKMGEHQDKIKGSNRN